MQYDKERPANERTTPVARPHHPHGGGLEQRTTAGGLSFVARSGVDDGHADRRFAAGLPPPLPNSSGIGSRTERRPNWAQNRDVKDFRDGRATGVVRMRSGMAARIADAVLDYVSALAGEVMAGVIPLHQAWEAAKQRKRECESLPERQARIDAERAELWVNAVDLAEHEKRILAVELNVARRHLTDAQKVLAGKAIEPDLAERARRRQGARTDLNPTLGATAPNVAKTRDEVAKAVGLGSGDTYERGEKTLAVVEEEARPW